MVSWLAVNAFNGLENPNILPIDEVNVFNKPKVLDWGVAGFPINLFFNPTNLLLGLSTFWSLLLLSLTTAKYFVVSFCTGVKPCLLKCFPKALTGTCANVLIPKLYILVGPKLLLMVLARLDTKPKIPVPLFIDIFLVSNCGLDNCKPIYVMYQLQMHLMLQQYLP